DTGQQVEAEGGDAEDQRLGHQPQPVAVAQEADERELVDDRKVERQQHGDDDEQRHPDPLRPRGQQARLGLVRRVEVRSSPHAYTRLISAVPKRPYGLMNRTISMTMYGTTS